jgi:hypothetical protein
MLLLLLLRHLLLILLFDPLQLVRNNRPNTPRIVIVDVGRKAAELFFPPSILVIARALCNCQLLNKLSEGTDLTLYSIVLGNNAPKRTYFVDVASEEGLGMVELGLEL